MEKRTIDKKIYLLLGLLVFLIIVILTYQKFKSNNFKGQTRMGNNVIPTVTEVPKTGSFSIALENPKLKPIKNQAVNIIISATSDARAIVGYDFTVRYDPNTISISQATSLILNFSLYPFKSANFISLTGTKKLNTTSETVFANTPIVRLTVVPKISGLTVLTIVTSQGNEKTKMVDNNTHILYPVTGELSLDVQ